MDIPKRPVAARALPLIAAFVAIQAQAQPLERVEITGSSIKRVQVEGPAPVETYRRQDIERTGATTVNELLKSISSIDIYDYGELASNTATGSGTAQARMRGLLESNVLVLLNGRRLPVNGLYDSTGSGAAVDLNMIPIAAIERIEILKDGASAIYGADAVAGVINLITRRSYHGIELRAGYGTPQQRGGAEKSAGLTFGFGDIEDNGYNVFAGIDVFKRMPIQRKDRAISSTADFRSRGGPDARSYYSPSGTYIDADGLPTGVTVRPCPAGSFNDDACRYDYNASDVLTAYNGADRISGLVIGTLDLPSQMRLTSELLLARAKNHFDSLPIADVFTGAGGDYLGRFMQGGPRTTDRQADQFQFSAGLEGEHTGLDWKVEAGQGISKVVNDDRNYFDRALFNAATLSGAIDPTVTTNSQALVDSLKVTPRREGRSTVTFLNSKVSGEFGRLPGGPFGFAVGSSFWRETLTDRPDALSQAGAVVGSIQQSAVDGSRNVFALFGELSLPLAKALETQLALRYDHYPTYARSSPKLAARYVIAPEVSVRGSYSRSFRAPALKQLYGNSEEGSATFTSEALCALLGQPAKCSIPGIEITGSNPDLKPERGETLNLGAVFEPVPEFSVSVDWWRVNVKDSIDTPTVDLAVAQGQVGQDALGRVVVRTGLRNFATIRNQGVDLDLRWKLPRTGMGQFSIRNSATYYIHQRKLLDSATGWQEFNGIYNRPRWRNTFTLSLESGPWLGHVALRNTSGFRDSDEPVPDPEDRHVEGFGEVDLIGSYAGFKSVKVDFGIKNLFNDAPPFSAMNTSSNLYTQMGFAELYSARGRFFYASLSYAF